MIKIHKLNCTACGAPISVPENLDYINCVSCGSFLAIERGEGYVALKIAEKIARAIENSGKGTQEVIRESTQVTRSELQRLQLAQEISTAQMQLANIQAEIRGLQRAELNGTTSFQLADLHFIEYQAMDRVRNLNTQLPSPDPADASAGIQFATTEIQWIDAEIQAINQSSSPQRQQISQSLTQRKKELSEWVLKIKVGELKKHLKSFNVQYLPLDQQAEAAALLRVMDEDETFLYNNRYLPEAQVVQHEFSQRQQTLRAAWKNMEQTRINHLVSSESSPGDANSISALNQYLNSIEQDLETLSHEAPNELLKKKISDLQAERKKTQKNIRKFEAYQARVNKKAAGSHAGNFFTVGLVGITAMFAGMVLFFKSIFSSPLSPHSPTDSTVPPGDPGLEMKSGDELIQSTAVSPARSVSAKSDVGRVDAKSLGKGCLLGLLPLVGSFIIGVFVFGIFFTEKTDPGSTIGMSIFFFCLTGGFALGSRSFLRIVAPNTFIRGTAGLPEIVFSNQKTEKGLRNPLAVKGLVAIITWILVYLFMLSLVALAELAGNSLYSTTLILGLFLGPAAAVLISSRTSVHSFSPGSHE